MFDFIYEDAYSSGSNQTEYQTCVSEIARDECANCSNPSNSTCSSCKTTRYCSDKCRILHWRRQHKDECVPKIETTRDECANCSNPSIAACSSCKTIRYCSDKCQILHWRRQHKDECVPKIETDSSSSGSETGIILENAYSSGSDQTEYQSCVSESESESETDQTEYQSCVCESETEIETETETEEASLIERQGNESCYVPVPVHSYRGRFHLYNLPNPKLGEVVGLVGGTRLGKTTALNILAGKLKPNLCQFEHPPGWDEILSRLGGSNSYLGGIKEKKITAVIKQQTLVDMKHPFAPRMRAIISKHSKENPYQVMDICEELGISLEVLSSGAKELSDGDLQRVMIAETALKKADSYIFDEPSNWLNMMEKKQAAKVIRSLRGPNRYVCVADHDKVLMDYMSDSVFCVEGIAQVYGEVKKDAAFVPVSRRANQI